MKTEPQPQRSDVENEIHDGLVRDAMLWRAQEMHKMQPPATDDRCFACGHSFELHDRRLQTGECSAELCDCKVFQDAPATDDRVKEQDSHAAREWTPRKVMELLGVNYQPPLPSLQRVAQAHNAELEAERENIRLRAERMQQLVSENVNLRNQLDKHDREQWRLLIDGKHRAICGKCGYPELIGSDDCRNCASNFNQQIGYCDKHVAEKTKPLVDALEQLRNGDFETPDGNAFTGCHPNTEEVIIRICNDALAKAKA